MIFYCTDSPIFTENGRYYTLGLSAIVKRYYEAFGKFIVLARVLSPVKGQPYIDVTEYFEEVIPLHSLKETIVLPDSLKKQIHSAVKRSRLVAIRMPAFSGIPVEKECRKQHKPLFIELCACPWDGLWNHSLAGKIVAPYMFFKTKRMTARAQYVHYVTEDFLQKRYPCNCPNTGVSNVVIKEVSETVLEQRIHKIRERETNRLCLMTSAAVNVRYKGQQYVIAAMAALKQKGIKITYLLAGGGDTSYLRSIAQKYGVEKQIVFLGRLSHEEVLDNLDKCDIYIQPSLQEGLPRALVEAMSRACPCIGAKTGGIPELLPPECIVKRKSPKAIEKAIAYLLENEMETYARKSFIRAKNFQKDILRERMNQYYQLVKDNESIL